MHEIYSKNYCEYTIIYDDTPIIMLNRIIINHLYYVLYLAVIILSMTAFAFFIPLMVMFSVGRYFGEVISFLIIVLVLAILIRRIPTIENKKKKKLDDRGLPGMY